MRNLSKVLSFSTLATLCAFLLQIVSVRLLSVNDYGILGKWLTDLTFFGLFFIFGLDNALLFFSKDPNKFYGNLKVNIIFFTSMLLFFCLGAFLFNSSNYFYLAICCYFFALVQSLNAYNQLFENFTKYGLINLVKNLFPLIFFLICLIINLKINIHEYLQYYTLVVVIFFLVVLYLFCKSNSIFISMENSFFKEYFIFGWKSMMNTFLAVFLYSSTIYFLNYFQGKDVVAIFFAASTLSKLAWVLPDSIGNVLYPKFLNINIKYNREAVFSETYFFAQLNFFLNLLAISGFLMVGRLFINLLYTNKYQQMFYVVVILLMGNQGMVYYKILGRYFASINEWRIQRIALFCGIFSNILLNLILTQYWGAIGAAIATSVSFWICGLVMSSAVKGSFIEFLNIKKLYGKAIRAK